MSSEVCVDVACLRAPECLGRTPKRRVGSAAENVRRNVIAGERPHLDTAIIAKDGHNAATNLVETGAEAVGIRVGEGASSIRVCGREALSVEHIGQVALDTVDEGRVGIDGAVCLTTRMERKLVL